MMEKLFNDFSIGLFMWQLLLFVLGIVIVFYIIKLFRRMLRYYNPNKQN